MDGTLVDTEPYWMSAETALVASYGGTWTAEEAVAVVGQGLEYSAQMLQAKGVELSEEEIIVGLTQHVLGKVKELVPWQPGARELLLALRKADVPTALVTMSRRPLAEYVAECTGGLFDVIVSGDDVENSKPDPESYLQAATLLGVDPGRCIAIEDSRPGVASAVSAGAVTIGVPHVAPLDASPAYTLWDTLQGKTIADLSALLAERVA